MSDKGSRSVFLNLTEEQKRHMKAVAAQRGLTLTALVTRVLTAYDAVGCPPAFRIVPDGPAADADPELGDGDAAWGWYQLQVVLARQEHDATVRQAYERYVWATASKAPTPGVALVNRCDFCNQPISLPFGIPERGDDAGWAELGNEHAPTCAWVVTRAYQGAEYDPSEDSAPTANSGAESGAVRSAEGSGSEAGRGATG